MTRGRIASLTWVKPARVGWLKSMRTVLRETFGRREEPRSSVEGLLLEHGIPTAGKATARDEAIALLQAAAEVEHSLLVQYLYAAYSLDPATDLARGRSIARIAHQEMGHLATVQNILSALGAAPYFDRQDRSPNADDPIPFLLEGLSKASLERYIAAEMPALEDIGDLEERELAEEILKRVGQTVQVRRVGALYAKIYWLFQKSDLPEGPISLPTDLFPPGLHVTDEELGNFRLEYQADDDEWQITAGTEIFVDRVASRGEILEALHRIMVQGEGWQPGQDTHYRRFMDAYRAFDSGATPLPVPLNPGSPTAPIGNPTARLLLELFDARYRLALTILVHCFTRSRDDEVQLRTNYLMPWALEEMRRILRQLGETIVTLPADDQPTERAAPAFKLDTFAIPEDEPQSIAAHRLLIDQTSSIVGRIRDAAGPEYDNILNPILARDRERLEILDQL